MTKTSLVELFHSSNSRNHQFFFSTKHFVSDVFVNVFFSPLINRPITNILSYFVNTILANKTKRQDCHTYTYFEPFYLHSQQFVLLKRQSFSFVVVLLLRSFLLTYNVTFYRKMQLAFSFSFTSVIVCILLYTHSNTHTHQQTHILN